MTPSPCPFCQPDAERRFYDAPLVYGLWDAFPVSPGHALVITKRHTPDWFAATTEERAALVDAIEAARSTICERHQPSGFNIGMNIGADAGQTVPHLHMHVIPRYAGDVGDPTGGVRNVIPGAGRYSSAPESSLPHERALVAGGHDDPLLPHLLAHLGEATAVDIAVAFVMQSGVKDLFEHLKDVLARGGRVRLITGDYRDVSEPDAMLKLCDLHGAVELRVFEAKQQSFHPKSFIVYRGDGEGTAFVGSSNLSRTALRTGVEWNYRVVTSRDQAGFRSVASEFDRLYTHASIRELTPAWIDSYRARRSATPAPDDTVSSELPEALPVPHTVQQEALRALEAARKAGAGAGLVVLATGLGKTWLSAFDSHRPEFGRVLFVAHRDEILDQARATFRRIRPTAKLGYFTGKEKAPEADVLFASIQTLGRQSHLDRFGPEEFDYIVVDEFHHAAAPTYRKLIEYFCPRFLLGLTATPERTDGGDLLALCGENLIYRCDLVEGIRRGLLSPFDYYGVPDIVDFANIPWRSGRFDETELTNKLATEARAENALEQYRQRAGMRTIGFCVSQRHADFMANYFALHGKRTAAVHSGASSAPRAHSLERLEQGDLDIVFAVDMFNEGVDLPALDTVMMLRPTESQILWLQQFGRGLRKLDGKRLKVIDYIGNHRSFLVKPRTLLGLSAGDESVREALNLLAAGDFELPPGCTVTYELEATDILMALLRQSPPGQRLLGYYEDFKERNGYRPSAVESYHDGFDPKSARPGHPSWLSFVQFHGDLTTDQAVVLQQLGGFLDSLEVTPMTKCFKMIVLLAMLAEDALPGELAVEQIAERVKLLARRYAIAREEFGDSLNDTAALVGLLEKNPIEAWAGARGTAGVSYFRYADRRFATTFTVAPELRTAAQDLTREIVEWRLAVYSRRVGGMVGVDRFTCKVSHTDGTPMLFLPPRDRMAGLPTGWVDITVDGQEYQANFVKIAVNVVQTAESDENQLPAILRGWFGENAGLPGTTFAVEFIRGEGGYTMQPAGGVAPNGPVLWESYNRSAVPGLFGFAFKGREGQEGFIKREGVTLLFVTLDKSKAAEEHKYKDVFESPVRFRWESQRRTKQASSDGRLISEHAHRKVTIHLFVREQEKVRGKTQPFIYCGPLTFDRWEGDKPITVWWKLQDPVPAQLWKQLRVKAGAGSEEPRSDLVLPLDG